jgi:hypothetical protein
LHPQFYGDIAQLVEHRTENPCVAGSNPAITTFFTFKMLNFEVLNPFKASFGDIAQLVEHRTENPCVAGSNPAITTSYPSFYIFVTFTGKSNNLAHSSPNA